MIGEPVMRGVDLLRIPESSDERMITGGVDPEMPVLNLADGEDVE